MLILASASPRRHELLLAAGIEHIVKPAAISEERRDCESARDFVRRLSREKSLAVDCGPENIVLGADTVVVVDGEIFGKPANKDDAIRMLRRLSGRDHWVFTGVTMRRGNREVTEVAETRVRFVPLSDLEIEEYTRSGEYIDKAGGYAIQGLASKFIVELEGSYHNVVGLPVSIVYRFLKTL